MTEQERIRRGRALGPARGHEGERHMGHGFRVIHIMIDKFFAKSWENDKRDLTRVQCSTLRYLYDHQDINIFQKDIEAAFSITGATASNILKGLERQGIIERIPMEEDARLKRILLTQEGMQFHERAIQNIERLEQALVAGMSETEIAAYWGFLEKTIHNLEQLVAQMRESEK